MRHDTTTAAAAPGPAIDIDIDIRCPGWRAEVAGIERVCRAAVESALAAAGAAQPVEISLVLADDAFVRTLNRSWRHQDAPTNVLAFPCDAAAGDGPASRLLGDVVVAYQTAAREAAEEPLALGDHLAHLIVHGTLHLLGFDHIEDAEAARMERLEAEALERLGIADPYRHRAP